MTTLFFEILMGFFSPKSPDPDQLRAKEGRQIRRETCFFRIRNHEKSHIKLRPGDAGGVVFERWGPRAIELEGVTASGGVLQTLPRQGRLRRHHWGAQFLF